MLRIDLLFLDLTTCTRCRGADRNLESALEVARDVLTAAGTEVEVNKIHVESAAQARELGLVSSPTIRVNGRDIAHELRESSCGSEGCTDGCGESIDCRVWVHRGREHAEPPVELILDAILREVYGGSAVERARDPEPYELAENLERFFAGKAAAAVPAAAGCCSPAEQSTCCEAEDKAECCGTATGTGCGCR
ncbi:MAG: DUF2703 domain-containing protein [Solirubrobacteraceae bacterium]